MKKPSKKAPAKERIVLDEHLRATTGGSGYGIAGGWVGGGDPPPDPNGGT
jgi:hypothetical protein